MQHGCGSPRQFYSSLVLAESPCSVQMAGPFMPMISPFSDARIGCRLLSSFHLRFNHPSKAHN
jgi:hypothetical protein